MKQISCTLIVMMACAMHAWRNFLYLVVEKTEVWKMTLNGPITMRCKGVPDYLNAWNYGCYFEIRFYSHFLDKEKNWKVLDDSLFLAIRNLNSLVDFSCTKICRPARILTLMLERCLLTSYKHGGVFVLDDGGKVIKRCGNTVCIPLFYALSLSLSLYLIL